MTEICEDRYFIKTGFEKTTFQGGGRAPRPSLATRRLTKTEEQRNIFADAYADAFRSSRVGPGADMRSVNDLNVEPHIATEKAKKIVTESRLHPWGRTAGDNLTTAGSSNDSWEARAKRAVVAMPNLRRHQHHRSAKAIVQSGPIMLPPGKIKLERNARPMARSAFALTSPMTSQS